MAHNTEDIMQIPTLSLTEGCNIIATKFKNEKEFTANLIPKLKKIIKSAYNLDIIDIKPEAVYNLYEYGFYRIVIDIYIKTAQGTNIVIECKNPLHLKAETFNAFAQLMSYQYLLSKVPNQEKNIFILATSRFDFFYFDFMKKFNMNFDLILNNEETIGFWINDLF